MFDRYIIRWYLQLMIVGISDDVISFCESDLSYFLEEDIRNKYEQYANAVLQYEIGEPEWMTESQMEKLELDKDILWIDQNKYRHVESAVDNAMSDLLPEQTYDEYTGSIRERRYDMSLDRHYYAKDEKKTDESEKIDALFKVLK